MTIWEGWRGCGVTIWEGDFKICMLSINVIWKQKN